MTPLLDDAVLRFTRMTTRASESMPVGELNAAQVKLMAKRRGIVAVSLWIAVLPSIPLLLAAYFPSQFGGDGIWSAIVTALFIGWSIYYGTLLLVWRCVKCGSRLGNTPRAKHCWSCGVNLLGVTGADSPRPPEGVE